MSGKVYEFINFIASDGCPASIMAPSPQFAEMRERALRAEAAERALRETVGELLDIIYGGDTPLCPTCHDVIEPFGWGI